MDGCQDACWAAHACCQDACWAAHACCQDACWAAHACCQDACWAAHACCGPVARHHGTDAQQIAAGTETYACQCFPMPAARAPPQSGFPPCRVYGAKPPAVSAKRKAAVASASSSCEDGLTKFACLHVLEKRKLPTGELRAGLPTTTTRMCCSGTL